MVLAASHENRPTTCGDGPPHSPVDDNRGGRWRILLRRLLGPLVEPIIFGVIARYRVFEHHFGTYMFFVSTGIDIGHLITFFFIGFVVALASRQREMVATLTLSLLFEAMAAGGLIYVVTTTGHSALLWRLPWITADCFVIVLAGAIVRTRRLAVLSRLSSA